jgi:peptide/nickel transport system permease protein
MMSMASSSSAAPKRRTSLWVGAGLILALLFVALVVPWLPIADPQAQDIAREFDGPSRDHVLGLGENGVDVLSQVLWSSRLSLGVGLGSVLLAAVIGLTIGSWAGLTRGWTDAVLMRIVDIVYAFPGILLVTALAAFLGPSIRNLIIALVITSWAGYARLARAATLSLRERDYVQAARAVGCSRARLLFKHIWPNLAAPIIVQMTYGLGGAILTESSLSFLGLGAPLGTPSWGQMLNQGREVLTSATHLVIVPGIALAGAVLGFNLLGDGLRDFFDPKLR